MGSHSGISYSTLNFAKVPIAPLQIYCTGDLNNHGEKEDCVPGIRAFSERYVFFASDGRKRSAIMPAEQHKALATK